jgi:hypothetical protein
VTDDAIEAGEPSEATPQLAPQTAPAAAAA